jgi:hypothetical protein
MDRREGKRRWIGEKERGDEWESIKGEMDSEKEMGGE